MAWTEDSGSAIKLHMCIGGSGCRRALGQRKLVRKSVCDGVTLRLCFRDTTLLENPIVVGMGLWYRVQGALRFLQRLDVEVRYLGCETSSLAFDLEDPKSVKRLRRFSQAMPLVVN